MCASSGEKVNTLSTRLHSALKTSDTGPELSRANFSLRNKKDLLRSSFFLFPRYRSRNILKRIFLLSCYKLSVQTHGNGNVFIYHTYPYKVHGG